MFHVYVLSRCEYFRVLAQIPLAKKKQQKKKNKNQTKGGTRLVQSIQCPVEISEDWFSMLLFHFSRFFFYEMRIDILRKVNCCRIHLQTHNHQRNDAIFVLIPSMIFECYFFFHMELDIFVYSKFDSIFFLNCWIIFVSGTQNLIRRFSQISLLWQISKQDHSDLQNGIKIRNSIENLGKPLSWAA